MVPVVAQAVQRLKPGAVHTHPAQANRPPRMDPLGFEADEADFNINLPTMDE
jgi:hypothetical protein